MYATILPENRQDRGKQLVDFPSLFYCSISGWFSVSFERLWELTVWDGWTPAVGCFSLGVQLIARWEPVKEKRSNR